MKHLITPILMLLFVQAKAQSTVTIVINNLENSNGNIYVSVFTSQSSFEEERPLKRIKIPKKGNMNAGVFKTTISLPPGKYGLALLDDDNSDGEMNYNWVGMPTEGFGFSDYYHSSLTRPVFSDFSFTLTKSPKTVKVKMRYM